MRPFLALFVALTLLGCDNQKPVEAPAACSLVDIGKTALTCDSLRNAGKNSVAAQLYFKLGKQNRSSELFVYSAWQFGESNSMDSALIAVKQAVKYGMNSPYVLDKLGIDEASKLSEHRPAVDQLLAEIKRKNSSVDNFEIVTTPMQRFWTYFDQALNDSARAKEHLSAFICEGSPAIRDYYHIRYENVDNMHRKMIQENPEYYAYVRQHISAEKLEEVAQESKTMMGRFSDLYPQAIFPKTYLVPDLINGSGTLTELGLFIGVTMFAKSEQMPLQNLNDWQLSHITEFENMKYDLVHELMHFQQSYGDSKNRELLLGRLIEEGVCDFLVTLVTDEGAMSPVMRKRLDYLDEPDNMAFVMDELKRDVYTPDLSKWMHNGGQITDRPSNLGYSMGYLICQSYYENSTDKEQAIQELLNTDDFKEIVAGSDYRSVL